MLFDRKITPYCGYCRYGSVVDDERAVCVKRGIVDSNRACRRFTYDPLKRKPETPVKFEPAKFTVEDFNL